MMLSETERLAVLVVDDDTGLVRTLSDILDLHGYRTHSASNGHGGLELAARIRPAPAVALVDLRLPDMDGMELVSRLHALSNLTEVVILTGNASFDSAVQALREQSCDYLIKPVAPENLLRTLGAASERWQRRRTEERFRLLLEHLSEIIVIVGADGVIHYQSPAVTHILGHGRDDQLGTSVLDQVHPDDRLRLRELLAARPATPVSAQIRVQHQDGSWRQLEVIGNNLLEHPEVSGIVLTARDVTERNQLEEQFRQAQKIETVGRLAGGVAHDFNNLLTVILGNVELLHTELGASDPRVGEVEEIRNAAQRATTLTRQLLAFSRKQVMAPKVLDLNRVVSDVDKMLHRLIGEDIDLVTALAPNLGHVRADPGQVEQVLVNLAVNARDAMPQGGKLTLETANVDLDEAFAHVHRGAAMGPHVMLAVSDTGSGMAPDTMTRVFEPFFTTKEPGKGTGLGLATVYGIVKQSGGSIWVYSELGRGSTFKIYLPRVEQVVSETANQVRTSTGSVGGTETILLVEDSPDVRAITERTLAGYGYTIVPANGPREALHRAEHHSGPIHLIVSDVVMPEMNGRELARLLGTLRPGVKVLFVSGYADAAVVHHGVLDPGTAYLQKPFTPEALARKVREVLDSAD